MKLGQSLIGSKIEVVDADNKNLIGLSGVVIDETQNTLVIDNGKKVLKAQVVLEVEGKRVNGKDLIGRVEDRLKKR